MTNRPRPIRSGPMVFFHIPKTAGTSVIHAFQSMTCWADTMTESGHITTALLAQAAALPVSPAKTLVFGHPYHDIMPGLRDATLLTVLREPEEQAVSNYLHLRRNPDTDLHAQANRLGFAAFMREHWHYLVFQNNALDVPNSSGPPATPAEFFARVPAIEQMLNRIDFIGTTDDLRGFTGTVARALGGRPPQLPRLHRSAEYGVTSREVTQLRRTYRALADDPMLAPLIAQERSLFAAAKCRAVQPGGRWYPAGLQRWFIAGKVRRALPS